jgi:RimJ/RimL family protein N-acetyltransferase
MNPQKLSSSLQDVSIEIDRPDDREQIISIINAVAAEKIYLQTDSYQPTPLWERLLDEGRNHHDGLALFVVQYKGVIFGFGRLNPDEFLGRSVGNVGILLLEPFRSKGIGTELLGFLIMKAPEFGFSSLSANILANNLISRRLFSHYGFEIIGRNNFFLPHSQPEKHEFLYVLDPL